jgi:hypothetical protein
MSKLNDQLKGVERERMEREKSGEEVAQARAGEERRALDLARERQATEVELRRLAHSRAEADAAEAKARAAQRRADEKALAALQKKLEMEKRGELAANRRAEAESAAADLLRAGIAAEEALDKQRTRTGEALQRVDTLRSERRALKERRARLRPWRLPLLAAVLALAVATLTGFVFLLTREPAVQTSFQPAGEPLKLKLEFAFPATRR